MTKNFINVYIADTENTDWVKEYELQGKSLEPARKARIDKCSTDSGKKILICTGLLLKKLLDKYGISSEDIDYEEMGKPFIRGRRDLFFNISNSGQYVAIAFSNIPVGIDIQKPVSYKEALTKRICSENELYKLGDEPVKHLNMVWAVKEAYTKLKGTGIAMDLKTISYDKNGDELKLYENGKLVAYGHSVFSDNGYETVVVTKDKAELESLSLVEL